MGRIVTSVQVENQFGPRPTPPVRVDALVDTGASHLVLPRAWKEKFGAFAIERPEETRVATQEHASVTLCGPAQIEVEGFSSVRTDILFLDMKPDDDGGYEPLLGYTVLELCKAAVDLDKHRLIPLKYFDLKRAGVAGEGR